MKVFTPLPRGTPKCTFYTVFHSSTGNNIQPDGFYFLEQSSVFQYPVAKGPSLGLSTFDILLKIICLITQLHSLSPTQKVPFLFPYSRTEDCCVTIHVMHDSSLAPLSPAPRQIYFYKCLANSWCCKEKLRPSFLTDNIRNFFHSAVLQKRKTKPYDSFSVGKCWLLNKNSAMLFFSSIEIYTSWITSWVSFNNSEHS